VCRKIRSDSDRRRPLRSAQSTETTLRPTRSRHGQHEACPRREAKNRADLLCFTTVPYDGSANAPFVLRPQHPHRVTAHPHPRWVCQEQQEKKMAQEFKASTAERSGRTYHANRRHSSSPPFGGEIFSPFLKKGGPQTAAKPPGRLPPTVPGRRVRRHQP